jgi:cell division protein FtsI (penicillin-binding protein 3)
VIATAVVFGLWTFGAEARLVYLQILQHDELAARAERQQKRTITAPAKRGEILDRDGRVLAYSVDAETVYAVPAEIGDPRRAADELCGALDDCTEADRQALVERLSGGRAFAYVRRQASPDQARRVAALDLPGVGFLKESRRYYPKRDLAAHLLGYVGVDNVGLDGIEATYDSQIRGHDGQIIIQVDARRHALFSRVERPPTAGADLELTIDQYIQYVAERELRAAVEESRASGGTIVVEDPWTGQILAMANWPTFNPNVFQRSPADARRNRAVQDLYEPGSTFKVVTASAALEEHIIRPSDPVDVSAGSIRFGARQIEDAHRYGVISFTDVIVKSSNVGAIKVGLRLGAERLGRYARRFGFGRPLSSDFRGESPGILWQPQELTDSALASMSMGYQVGVTALQMAAAVSAVANGGQVIEPRVVRAVIREGARSAVPMHALHRAISPETAATLTTIMEQVVERGTGRAAQIQGYQVAGKTGTAHKLIDGRYSKADYFSSFVGFVPSRRPAITVLVMIDSPRAKGYFGGTVAAPVFERVAEAALRHLGIGPTVNPVPPVLVARTAASSPALVLPRPTGSPAPTFKLIAADASRGLMPDLRGLSAREALRGLAQVGLSPRIVGDGVVVEQEPEPGAPVERGSAALLRLERRYQTGGVSP